jgi:hypothetical protein
MWYALLTIFFGLVALYVARRGYAVVSKVADWPTVPGRIMERGVRGGRYYKAYARYTYAVDGTEFENDQVYPIPGTYSLAWQMRRVVEALPNEPEVRYNPAQPARSFLVPQPMATLHIAAVFGGVVTTVGVLLLLMELL